MRLCYCFILLVMASVARGEWKVAPEAMVTRWGKQVTPQNVWQEYPRPQFRRDENWKNLERFMAVCDFQEWRYSPRLSGRYSRALSRGISTEWCAAAARPPMRRCGTDVCFVINRVVDIALICISRQSIMNAPYTSMGEKDRVAQRKQ